MLHFTDKTRYILNKVFIFLILNKTATIQIRTWFLWYTTSLVKTPF